MSRRTRTKTRGRESQHRRRLKALEANESRLRYLRRHPEENAAVIQATLEENLRIRKRLGLA